MLSLKSPQSLDIFKREYTFFQTYSTKSYNSIWIQISTLLKKYMEATNVFPIHFNSVDFA